MDCTQVEVERRSERVLLDSLGTEITLHESYIAIDLLYDSITSIPNPSALRVSRGIDNMLAAEARKRGREHYGGI